MEVMSSDNENLFNNLPSLIIIDILTRLPIKTISRCRCVCKVWLELISNLEFDNLFKLRSSTSSLMIIRNMTSMNFNMVELEDEPTNHDFYYLPGTKMEPPKKLRQDCTFMFGSINSLLCFYDFHFGTVHLWNPATHESITIPSPGGEMLFPNNTTVGFGLSSINCHYKLVRIHQEIEGEGNSRRISKSECHVYTLGQGCWRNKGYVPFEYCCRFHGVFLNGNLHWLIQDRDGPEQISCFDLEKESFGPFPAPPGLDKYHESNLEVYKDDRLSVCDNTSEFEITIWVMNEYGVKHSWVKAFVIAHRPIHMEGFYDEFVQILKVFKDGEILLLLGLNDLISYNSKSNSSQLVDICKFIGIPNETCFIEVVDYIPSFLSLKRFRMEIVEEDTF